MPYTNCTICKRPLKRRESQLIGMGKVCANKNNFNQLSMFNNESNPEEMLKGCAHAKAIFEYKPPHAGIIAKCEVREVFKNGKKIVIFTELPDNPGMTVINASEYVIKSYEQENPNKGKTIYIEHSCTAQGDSFSIIDDKGNFTHLSGENFLKLIK